MTLAEAETGRMCAGLVGRLRVGEEDVREVQNGPRWVREEERMGEGGRKAIAGGEVDHGAGVGSSGEGERRWA